jgi:type II secretory pathway pseudopilin PulG
MTASRSSSPPAASSGGFSLVEIVVAIGLISFCLVSLIGLLSVGLDTSRESVATTTNAMLFEKVVNQLRVAAVAPSLEQKGVKDQDLFWLPVLAPVLPSSSSPSSAPAGPRETTFTVDSLSRFLCEGATTDGDAAKVVTIHVQDPCLQPIHGMATNITPLSNGGKIAFVRVTIKSAQGYQKDVSGPLSSPSEFWTEIHVAFQ